MIWWKYRYFIEGRCFTFLFCIFTAFERVPKLFLFFYFLSRKEQGRACDLMKMQVFYWGSVLYFFILHFLLHLNECRRRSSCGRWENLECRRVLCDWCRGCMPMHGAVSMLVRGTVKSLKWGSVFTKARYSARCSSSLCLKPCHASSALSPLGGPLCRWPCYHRWTTRGMCQ